MADREHQDHLGHQEIRVCKGHPVVMEEMDTMANVVHEVHKDHRVLPGRRVKMEKMDYQERMEYRVSQDTKAKRGKRVCVASKVGKCKHLQ